MKNDLATAIIATIAGITVAYFVTDMIVSNLAKSTYPVKVVDSAVTAEVADPNPEVFNYNALNPTVEVYVGNCTETNMYGECVDESSEQIEEGIIDNEGDDSNKDSNSSSDNTSNNQRNNRNGSSD